MRCNRLPVRAIVAAIGAIAWQQAVPNPTGPNVVTGVSPGGIAGLGTSTVNVTTNAAKSIINWQRFSIGSGENTMFSQPSATAAVLNRVTSHDASSILGSLQSNGRVFLINPNGITFGVGSHVDVAGLVASSLNLSDSNFLSGHMLFTTRPSAGAVVNNGTITSTGRNAPVYLVGPSVRNGGIIASPEGEVVLAAARSVEVLDPSTPDVTVQINAVNNRAVNLGQIVADSGRINIWAGSIAQNGTIAANTVVTGQDGAIVLRASRDLELNDGSLISALLHPEDTFSSGGGGRIDMGAGRDISITGGHAQSASQNVQAGRDIAINNGGGLLVAAEFFPTIGHLDVHAGRSLTIDHASIDSSIGSVNPSVSASDATLRNGCICAFQGGGPINIVVENGGRLRLADGSKIFSSAVNNTINFTSGGRLILRGGDAPNSGVAIGAVYGSRSPGSYSITGSPDITLFAGGSSADINAYDVIQARSLTLIGGRTGGSDARVTGSFSQHLTVDRKLVLRADGGSARLVQLGGTVQTITVGGGVSLTGGRLPHAQAELGSFGGKTDLNVGGLLRIEEGTAADAWARVIAASGNGIHLNFPNRSRGGWFVNGVPGAVTNGSSGFFAGNAPAVLGNTLVVTYGP